MEKMDWSIISKWDWYIREDFLFTYSDAEKRINTANKQHSDNLLNMEFIKYQKKYKWILTKDENLLLSFFEFYSWWEFYYSNEQYWELIEVSVSTIKNILKSLKDKWYINIVYKKVLWLWTMRKVSFNTQSLNLPVIRAEFCPSSEQNFADDYKNKEYIKNNIIASQSATATPTQTINNKQDSNAFSNADDTARCGDSANEKNIPAAEQWDIDFEKVFEILPASKWWDYNKSKKEYDKKILKWYTPADIYKGALLYKLQLREWLVDFRYQKLKENWIRDYCKYDDWELDTIIYNILYEYYKRKSSWKKIKTNTPLELSECFGKDLINELYKQAQKDFNSNQK